MTLWKIINTAIALYERHDFRGLIGFHLYNEPMLEWDRMLDLIAGVKKHVNRARFGLLTNGTLLDKSKTKGIKQFYQVQVSNYENKDWSWLKTLVPSVLILSGKLDARANPPEDLSDVACGRIWNEIIFDYYGNCHPCCMDWRGEIPLGNLHAHDLSDIVTRFQALRSAIYPMSPAAPAKCRKCFGRLNGQISRLVDLEES